METASESEEGVGGRRAVGGGGGGGVRVDATLIYTRGVWTCWFEGTVSVRGEGGWVGMGM